MAYSIQSDSLVRGRGSVHGWGDITEGFTMQYTWYVPHDVQGYINLAGKKLSRSGWMNCLPWSCPMIFLVLTISRDALADIGMEMSLVITLPISITI